jgi:hypothetical protein
VSGYFELRYLEHLLTKFVVKVDPDKTRAIELYPEPKTKNELHSFLSLCSYYRRFVRKYSAISASLSALLKQDAEFIWPKTQADTFQKLKRT